MSDHEKSDEETPIGRCGDCHKPVYQGSLDGHVRSVRFSCDCKDAGIVISSDEGLRAEIERLRALTVELDEGREQLFIERDQLKKRVEELEGLIKKGLPEFVEEGGPDPDPLL